MNVASALSAKEVSVQDFKSPNPAELLISVSISVWSAHTMVVSEHETKGRGLEGRVGTRAGVVTWMSPLAN